MRGGGGGRGGFGARGGGRGGGFGGGRGFGGRGGGGGYNEGPPETVIGAPARFGVWCWGDSAIVGCPQRLPGLR